MTAEPQCLCEQCKMTVEQCRERSTKSEAVLEEIETRLVSEATKAKGWKNKTLGIEALINEMEVAAKDIKELRTKEP